VFEGAGHQTFWHTVCQALQALEVEIKKQTNKKQTNKQKKPLKMHLYCDAKQRDLFA